MKTFEKYLKEQNPIKITTGLIKDPISGTNEIIFFVKFPNDVIYREIYSSSPFILNKFIGMVKKNMGLKPYHWLKKNAELKNSEKIVKGINDD